MAGRVNYQTCAYQCIRPGELWQCNWLEETGTICSLVYDIKEGKISTLLGFSKGHWECPEEAHGDKRDPETFERWRGLAKMGKQSDRFMLTEVRRRPSNAIPLDVALTCCHSKQHFWRPSREKEIWNPSRKMPSLYELDVHISRIAYYVTQLQWTESKFAHITR